MMIAVALNAKLQSATGSASGSLNLSLNYTSVNTYVETNTTSSRSLIIGFLFSDYYLVKFMEEIHNLLTLF